MKISFLIRSFAAKAFTRFTCSRLRAGSSRSALPRQSRRRRVGPLLALAALFPALSPFALSAATYDWTGLSGADDRWETEANWNGPTGRAYA